MAEAETIRYLTSKSGPHKISETRLRSLLEEKIDKPSASDCWLWTGRMYPTGYGRISIDGLAWYTHRISYELHNGPIPDGLHLDHLCRNRACCNPRHLDPVTCRENVLRSPIAPAAMNARKTRCPYGHPLSGTNLVARKSDRQRGCRTCAQWRARVIAAKKAGRPFEEAPPTGIREGRQLVTECRKGHPYDDANTYTAPNGSRRCRACESESRRRYNEKQAGVTV